MTSDAHMTTPEDGVAAPAADFKVTERYRRYVLWSLFTVYVFNFVDRSILTILIQPMRAC